MAASSFMKKTLDQQNKVKTLINEKLQGDSVLKIPDPALQWGTGGWSRARCNLLWGPSGCLDEDTHINYQTIDSNGKRQDHKGGTIKRLYYRFHGLSESGKGMYQRKQSKNSKITITSVDDEGRMFRNEIVNVIYSGVKECFELVTEKGKKIIATADHKFTTNGHFLPLSELKVGDYVLSYDPKLKGKKEKEKVADYEEFFVKYHPSERFKTIGKKYTYCRVPKHRAVVESEMNGLPVEKYISFLNTESPSKIRELYTLARNMAVHHINEDKRDNRLSNLMVLSHAEHSLLHLKNDPKTMNPRVSQDQIVSITPVGKRETYDIMCNAPFNNFVANGIVVHNSGKSTLSLMGAALEQKRTGGYVIVFDSEYAYKDPNDVDEDGKLTDDAKTARARLELAGINIEKFLLIQSNQVDILFGGLSDLEKDIKSKSLHVSAIIVDSWGGVQSESAQKKIEDGDISSVGNHFGGNAKLMGPILQSLLRIAAETATTMFFVQHCIQNMDQYGPRWVLIGGEKLKFLIHGSIFVETVNAKDAHLLAGGGISESNKDEDLVFKVGKKIRFSCEKSRATINGRKGEFWMDFDRMQFALPEVSLFNLAAKLGVIGHPTVPDMQTTGLDKGKQKVDPKTGEPVFKTLDAYWEFPANAPGAKKWHGQGQTIAALQADKVLFEDVLNNCMDGKHKDALKGEKIGQEVNDETEKKAGRPRKQ